MIKKSQTVDSKAINSQLIEVDALSDRLGEAKDFETFTELLVEIWSEEFSFEKVFFLPLKTRENGFIAFEEKLVTFAPMGTLFLRELAKHLEQFPREAAREGGQHLLLLRSVEVALFFLSGDEGVVGVFCWIPKPGVEVSAKKQLKLGALLCIAQQLGKQLLRLDEKRAIIYQDDLTKVYNYRYLDLCLTSEIKRVNRFPSSFSLLFIDLDSFKPINDTHGHLVGSRVICQVAELLQEDLRDVDSVFRYGGDEFVIMLVEVSPEMAAKVAERIRKKIAAYRFDIGNHLTGQLTVSIGIACCPHHSRDKEELLRLADQSMYKSKHTGKNRVVMAMSPVLEKSS